MTTRAYVGIGCNWGQRFNTVMIAAQAVSKLGCSPVLSSIYRSRPQGGPMQPDYWNAVIGISTIWTPVVLLRLLMQVEQRFGRSRSEHWGPRTLDLDLLIYGTVMMDTKELVLPHPRIAERRFVLQPLSDIAPEGVLPRGQRIHTLLDHVRAQEVSLICSVKPHLLA